MLKILQAAIIPVLLCSNLLGDEDGVEKWPKFLGKGIEWGMSSKDATAKMTEKSYKLKGKVKAKPPFDKLWANILTYRGRFLRIDATVALKFDHDDKLSDQIILLGTHSFDQKWRSESLKTGFKLRDLLVKQYGKPSTEELVKGDNTKFSQVVYEGGGSFLTRKEALAAKTDNVHYTVCYNNKKTEKHDERRYIYLYSNNGGTCSLSSKGPAFYDFFRDILGK
jgi:hypothetical protein